MKFNYWILSSIFYCLIGTSYAAESDPPILNAISVDKTVVDVSNGSQVVTFATDIYDASGIDWDANGNQINLSGPKTLLARANNDVADVFTVTVNTSTPSGFYEIRWISLYDELGNISSYSSSNLLDFGLPSHIKVIDENYNFNFDFDENGSLDALTDGLLLLRYAFGLREENLTNAAIGSGSTLSPEEVAMNVEQVTGLADIDKSGTLDALTDGLIFLRYAFGLRGDSLVSGAISSDATRTSAADIEAYIESHMP